MATLKVVKIYCLKQETKSTFDVVLHGKFLTFTSQCTSQKDHTTFHAHPQSLPAEYGMTLATRMKLGVLLEAKVLDYLDSNA